MLTWSNTGPTGASKTAAAGAVIVNGDVQYRGIWIATAQDLTDQTGVIGRVAEEAVRTSTSCFMRGLSEHVRIQTSSGTPWFHRRVCFTYKGNDLQTFTADSPNSTQNRYLDTTVGMQRLMFNENVNIQPNTINVQDAIIFKGAKGLDWNDELIAPLDHRRISVKYDKIVPIRSGNERGTAKEYKLWHPMSKNIIYADDETGDSEVSSYTSTSSKAGMGDYYVMDIIKSGTGGNASDLLQFSVNSTLYWHEK